MDIVIKKLRVELGQHRMYFGQNEDIYREMNLELKKRIIKSQSGLSNVCSRNMDFKRHRQKEDRSL